jgi:hypothetical protein
MTATPSIDLPGWMAEQLSQASPDLLRNMIQTFAEALMSADADAVCGAGYGHRSTERTLRSGSPLQNASSRLDRSARLGGSGSCRPWGVLRTVRWWGAAPEGGGRRGRRAPHGG